MSYIRCYILKSGRAMISRRELFVGTPLLIGQPAKARQAPRAGCQTNAWPIEAGNFAQFLAVLDRVRQLGFSGFETGFRNAQGRFDAPAFARAEIEKTKLRFLGVHIFLTACDPQDSIPAWDLLSRVADGGSALGAERLIVSGRAVSVGGKLDIAAVGRKSDALSRAGEYCRKKGIAFAYHNHNFEFTAAGAEMEELIRRTDPALVGLALDAGHAYAGGVDVVRFFRRHSRRIHLIHLRDFRGGQQVPLGQGEFNMAPLARAIRESAWAGWLVNEEERPNDVRPGDAVVEPARKHVKKVFGI